MRHAVSRTRVAVVTNVLPHYRGAFYDRLFQRRDLDVHVFCQRAIPGMNLETVHARFPRVSLVPAMSLSRERLAWQWLPWARLLSSFDVLFVSGNPRVVSNVVLATAARVLGRPVVLWGQAHTANADPRTERLRHWWWRRFRNLFVYTDGEARWLRGRGFTCHHIVGMNNGLDQRRIDAAAASWTPERLHAWRRQEGLEGRAVVLSCARLEPKNRFDLWLSAMPAVIARVPDLLWCVIGDGEERRVLEARGRDLGLDRHVRWLGALVDEDRLAPWFLASRLLVHPEAIGLTLLHAFGYGLPVVTQDDPAGQMPEFDAFVPGRTGMVYRRGDAADLGDTVGRCLRDDKVLDRMGDEARRIAREAYNVDVMVERFVAMAMHARGPRPALSEATGPDDTTPRGPGP